MNISQKHKYIRDTYSNENERYKIDRLLAILAQLSYANSVRQELSD